MEGDDPADLLLSVHEPFFSTRYLFFGCEPCCESSCVFANPSHQCRPAGGLPGKPEEEEPWSGSDSLVRSGLTALVQRSWKAYPGKILPIARRPDHRTHLSLTSIGKLNYIVLCRSRAWSDLDLPFSQRLFQFQAHHWFQCLLCFEPPPQAPLAIDFQEAKVIQVPEEAFAQ